MTEKVQGQICQEKEEGHRIFGLDMIRIICALLIYGRHSVTMYGCSYGEVLNNVFIELTSPVMTCFFVLSGFSLYYANRNQMIFEGKGLFKFYIKRMGAILPAYYLIHLIWLVFNRKMLSDWIFLTPLEIFGIQSVYNTLFGILHNGGTWFVSCIIICYFIYPILQEMVAKLSVRLNWILAWGGVIYFICVYSYFVVNRFQLGSNYANPFFRVLEFTFGVIISAVLTQITNWKEVLKEKRILIVILWLILLVLCLAGYYKFGAAVFFKIVLCMPVIAAMIVFSYFIRNSVLENSKALQYLSTISYYFFLIQLFLWKLSSKVLGILHLNRNRYKIIVSFSLCLILSIVIYEFFDKPIRKKIGKLVEKI